MPSLIDEQLVSDVTHTRAAMVPMESFPKCGAAVSPHSRPAPVRFGSSYSFGLFEFAPPMWRAGRD